MGAATPGSGKPAAQRKANDDTSAGKRPSLSLLNLPQSCLPPPLLTLFSPPSFPLSMAKEQLMNKSNFIESYL